MEKVDRQPSDRDQSLDQTGLQTPPGKYIPMSEVDLTKYEIMHPETAITRLGMSARTAYRKIDSGELEYTLDKGSKRVLVKRDLSMSDQGVGSVSQLSVINRQQTDLSAARSDGGLTTDRLLSEIGELKEEVQILREKLETTQQLLSDERVKASSLAAKVEASEDRLNDKQALVEEVKKRAESERTRAESFNNQVASAQSLVMKSKGADSYMKELVELMKEANKKTVVQVQQQPAPSIDEKAPKKGFRFFGIRISMD